MTISLAVAVTLWGVASLCGGHASSSMTLMPFLVAAGNELPHRDGVLVAPLLLAPLFSCSIALLLSCSLGLVLVGLLRGSGIASWGSASSIF